MNKPLQTMVFGSCCICAALALPRPSLAAPPTVEPEARTVRLEVDVEDLGDKGIGLDQTVRDQLGPRITRADFELVGEDEDEAAVTLRVRFRALQSGDYDYGVHFEFVDEGEPEAAIEWIDCHMCVDARLMPVLDEQTPALLAALVARVTEFESVAVPEPVRDDPAYEAVETRDRGEVSEPRAITSLGITGAVVAGLGVGALIGGGVEVGRGVDLEDGSGEIVDRTDHQTPGYVLIGLGSTALVTGVVLLAVDLGRQTKKRKHARARQAHFYPMFTPDGAGLGVLGKF